MPPANTVEIRVVTTGAEQAARVLSAIATAGGDVGIKVSTGTKQAEQAFNSLGNTIKRVFEIATGVGVAALAAKMLQLGQAAYDAGLQAAKAESGFRGMT